ncbi:Bax inhibitor-1/YccA family protein [Lacunimicrobium album]
MSANNENYYARQSGANDVMAFEATADARAIFLRNTYLHLMGAIIAFVMLTTVFINTPPIVNFMLRAAQNWWLVLAAFMGVGWLADRWAYSGASKSTQYAGLALYVVAQSLIFVPLLFIVAHFGGGFDVILQAGCLTVITFGALTAVVMMTGADFGFLRTFLFVAGMVALGTILAGSIFGGFVPGTWFIGAMMLLMSGYILFNTSEILHRYPTDAYVGASLALFSSIATLFWYILQFLNSRE